MKNDTRNRATNRPVAVSLHYSLLVCFGAQTLMPLVALADTGLPPPTVQQSINTSFPSAQALQRQGYDPQTGVWRVKDNNVGRPTVTSNGGTITGTQSKAVTVTGKYGEKATIQTATTQKVGSSALSKGIAAAYVLDSANNPNTRGYAEKTGQSIKQGDYLGAAHNAVLTVGSVLDSITGGSLGEAAKGLGEGLGKLPSGGSNDAALKRIFDRAKQGQAAAEKRGDFAGATVNAAVKKAAEAASNASAQSAQQKAEQQEAEKKGKKVILIRFLERGVEDTPETGLEVREKISWKSYTSDTASLGRSDIGDYSQERFGNTLNLKLAEDLTINYEFEFKKSKQYPRGSSVFVSTFTPADAPKEATLPNIADPNLSGSEVEAILKRMLESQQTNHEELMKQLAKMGDAVEKATTSQEWTAKTATTEPYTPAGSDTPQQTQFSIDKNGNISVKTISRPDLKPHSSQAPTRTEIVKKADNAQTNQQQQNQQQQNQQNQNTNQTGQQQNQTGQQTGQTGQTTATTGQTGQQQQQERQNFCQQNPRAAACAELGETDYEDLEIPENVIDLNFEPADIFQTDGVCPQPKIVNLGVFGTVEFSYQQICDFASLLRPVLIAAIIMMCAWFVFESVREL